jgi:hypothetical protein
LNGFEGNAAMTSLRDPSMKDVFVDQALDRADRELKKFSGFAGATASGGGLMGHACLLCKTPI